MKNGWVSQESDFWKETSIAAIDFEEPEPEKLHTELAEKGRGFAFVAVVVVVGL